MLGYLRRRAGSLIIKFLFGIIILVFVFFYGFDDKQDQRETTVASVGETVITVNQLMQAHKNLMEFYRNIYKENLSPEILEKMGLKETALENLIDREVLLQEAKRMKIRVGKDELRGSIIQDPLFQEDGFFSQRRYDYVLGYHGISSTDYEKDKKTEIMLQKIENMVKTGVTVSENEVYDYYVANNEKAWIEYMVIDPEDMPFDQTVSENEIGDFYEANKEIFRKPEMAKVSCLIFEPDFFLEKVEISPEEVQQVYESEKYRFFEPMQVRARHILVKKEKEDDEEKIRELKNRAEAVLEKIEEGEAFEKLAEEISDDKVSADKGGDLGFFKSGDMVGKFEEVAFSLEEGQISPVVETELGFHIIKVEEIKPEQYREFEEVKDIIIEELKREKARDMTTRQARRAYSRLFQSRDLEEYAQTTGVELKKTDYFVYGGSKFDTLKNKVFSQTAFSLAQGEIAPVFSIGQKYYLIRLDEIRPSFIPEAEEVRQDIEKEVLKEKSNQSARLLAQEIISDVSEGLKEWKNIEKTEGVSRGETELKRTGDFISGIGRVPEMKKDIFSQGKENQVASKPYEVDRKFYIVKLLEKKLPSEDKFEEEKEDAAQTLLNIKREEAFKNFLNILKAKTNITVNTKLLSSV